MTVWRKCKPLLGTGLRAVPGIIFVQAARSSRDTKQGSMYALQVCGGNVYESGSSLVAVRILVALLVCRLSLKSRVVFKNLVSVRGSYREGIFQGIVNGLYRGRVEDPCNVLFCLHGFIRVLLCFCWQAESYMERQLHTAGAQLESNCHICSLAIALVTKNTRTHSSEVLSLRIRTRHLVIRVLVQGFRFSQFSLDLNPKP